MSEHAEYADQIEKRRRELEPVRGYAMTTDGVPRLWRSLGPGQWEPVVEFPRGFTEADVVSLHTVINGLLRRMLSGYDNEGNRIRTMEQEGATKAAIEWLMGEP